MVRVEARSLIIKILLRSRVLWFIVTYAMWDIQISSITTFMLHISKAKTVFKNMLDFYNFPKDCILNNSKFLATCLQKKAWTKCLTDFLKDAHY